MNLNELQAKLDGMLEQVDHLERRLDFCAEKLSGIVGDEPGVDLEQALEQGDEEEVPPEKEPATATATAVPVKSETNGHAPHVNVDIKDLPLHFALAEILSRKDDTLTVAELSEAVLAAGYKTESKNFKKVVQQCIWSNPTDIFYREKEAKPARIGLAKWLD